MSTIDRLIQHHTTGASDALVRRIHHSPRARSHVLAHRTAAAVRAQALPRREA